MKFQGPAWYLSICSPFRPLSLPHQMTLLRYCQLSAEQGLPQVELEQSFSFKVDRNSLDSWSPLQDFRAPEAAMPQRSGEPEQQQQQPTEVPAAARPRSLLQRANRRNMAPAASCDLDSIFPRCRVFQLDVPVLTHASSWGGCRMAAGRLSACHEEGWLGVACRRNAVHTMPSAMVDVLMEGAP